MSHKTLHVICDEGHITALRKQHHVTHTQLAAGLVANTAPSFQLAKG